MKYVNKEKMLRSQGYMQKKPIQNNTTKVHHPHPNNNSSKNNFSSKKSKLIKGTSIAAMGLTGLGLVGYVISRSNDDITKMNKNKKVDKSLEFGKFTNKLEKKKDNSDHKADHTNQKIEKKKKLSNDKNKSKNASEHINNEIDMLTKFSNAKISPKTYEHKLHNLKAIDAIKSDSIKQNTNELSKLAQKAKESKLLANSLGVDKKEIDKTIKQDKIFRPIMPVKPITSKPESSVSKPVVPVKPVTPRPEPVVPKPVVPVKPVMPKPIDTKAVTLTNVRLTPYNNQISGTTNPFATIKIESVKDKTLIGQTTADKSGYFTTNLKNKLYKGENIKITAVDEKTGVNTALILVAPEPVSQLPAEKIPNGTTKKVTFVKADGTKIGEGELVKEGTSVKVNNLPDNYKLIDKAQLLQWPDRLTLNEDTSKPASILPAEKIPNGTTKKVTFVKADGTKIGEGELVKEGTSVKVNNLPGNYKLIDKSQLLQWPDQLTLIEETKH